MLQGVVGVARFLGVEALGKGVSAHGFAIDAVHALVVLVRKYGPSVVGGGAGRGDRQIFAWGTYLVGLVLGLSQSFAGLEDKALQNLTQHTHTYTHALCIGSQ